MTVARRGTDLWLAGAAFAAGLLLYGPLAWRLGQGEYVEYYNLAFDFDPPPAVRTLTGSGATSANYDVKHPLFALVRPLGAVLGLLRLGPDRTSTLAMAVAGATTVAGVFAFLRVLAIGRAQAMALAALFAVGATPLVVAMVPETYGFALSGLVLVWLLAALSMPGGEGRGWRPPWALRCAAAVLTAGITLTNAMQAAVAELAVASGRRPGGWRPVLRHMLATGLVCGAAFGALALALHWHALAEAVRDPREAVRRVLWLQTQGEKTGPLEVFRSLLAHSFVAPDPVVIRLPLGMDMLDFRGWAYRAWPQAVTAGWLAFAAAGAAGWAAHRRRRPLMLAIAVTLACNVVFHFDFQFRGSVFLYAAHTHFLVFALACGLAPAASRPSAGRAYVAAVLALALAVASVNLPMAWALATGFDHPRTECAKPC